MKCIVSYLLSLIFLILFPGNCFADRLHPEKWYQEKWCNENNGVIEVILKDKTRCDCVTVTHAIEFEFGRNWSEGIGQSLYYAFMTGKKAGVVIILENSSDRAGMKRLLSTITHYHLPIDYWLIEVGTDCTVQ